MVRPPTAGTLLRVLNSDQERRIIYGKVYKLSDGSCSSTRTAVTRIGLRSVAASTSDTTVASPSKYSTPGSSESCLTGGEYTLSGGFWFGVGFVDCNSNGIPDGQDITVGTSQDCNTSGIPDGCDIAAGTSQDYNGNGVPDECEPAGDLDGDLDVDADDFAIFLAMWGRCTGDPEFNADADFDGDGCITIVDYQIWLQYYRDFIENPLADPPVGTLGDFDWDGDVDLADFASLQECMPAPPDKAFPCAVKFDFNGDNQIGLLDFAEFQEVLTGP